jgi:hypothetical protein
MDIFSKSWALKIAEYTNLGLSGATPLGCDDHRNVTLPITSHMVAAYCTVEIPPTICFDD